MHIFQFTFFISCLAVNIHSNLPMQCFGVAWKLHNSTNFLHCILSISTRPLFKSMTTKMNVCFLYYLYMNLSLTKTIEIYLWNFKCWSYCNEIPKYSRLQSSETKNNCSLTEHKARYPNRIDLHRKRISFGYFKPTRRDIDKWQKSKALFHSISDLWHVKMRLKFWRYYTYFVVWHFHSYTF